MNGTTAQPAAGALLVLLTGHPASGKSSLAARLVTRFRLPVLAKDDVQEALFDAGLAREQGTAAAANLAILRVAERLLATGRDCIVDSNLEAARWQPEVARVLAQTGARLLQVRCRADGPVLLARFAARVGARHPGHRDEAQATALRERLLGPPPAPLDLPGERLDLDTGEADETAAEALVEAVGHALGAYRRDR